MVSIQSLSYFRRKSDACPPAAKLNCKSNRYTSRGGQEARHATGGGRATGEGGKDKDYVNASLRIGLYYF